jgi:RNA polymerase sigma-70 factor, ECF subfamily
MTQTAQNQLFTELYNKYNKGIYVYINKAICNPVVSNELMNDCFLKSFQHYETFKPELATYNTWLHKIAMNMCIDYFRSANKQSAAKFKDMPENFQPVNNTGYASDLIEGKELKNSIFAAMANLKETEKNCINLFFIEGKSHAEIVDILQISLSNVKVTLLRAKEKLKESLQPAYVEL